MSDARTVGAALAERHQATPAPSVDRYRSLLNVAESPRIGDWTLRSALTRLAQPHPQVAADVLMVVRRCEQVLRELRRDFETHPVASDPRLRVVDGQLAPPSDTVVADGRTADLARLLRYLPTEADDAIRGYESATETLSDGERFALPVLTAMLGIDDLADHLAGWAVDVSGPPPVEVISDTITRLGSYIDQIGVPRDTGGPPRGRTRGSAD